MIPSISSFPTISLAGAVLISSVAWTILDQRDRKIASETKAIDSTVYQEQEVDQAPVWVNESVLRTHLAYPEMARNAGIEGRVTLSLLIGPRGEVESLQVAQACHPLLEVACMELMVNSHFRAAKHRGQAVSCWKALDFLFFDTAMSVARGR